MRGSLTSPVTPIPNRRRLEYERDVLEDLTRQKGWEVLCEMIEERIAALHRRLEVVDDNRTASDTGIRTARTVGQIEALRALLVDVDTKRGVGRNGRS